VQGIGANARQWDRTKVIQQMQGNETERREKTKFEQLA
jgi:hypothetical protein